MLLIVVEIDNTELLLAEELILRPNMPMVKP
jgi:hypothetical protein